MDDTHLHVSLVMHKQDLYILLTIVLGFVHTH